MGKGGYQKRRIALKKEAERAARKRAERNKMFMRVLVGVGVVGLFVVVLIVAFAGGDKKPLASPSPSASPTTAATPVAGCTAPDSKTAAGKQYKAAPKMSIDSSKIYTVTFTTTCGPLEMKLEPKLARATVNNFVFLAKDHFYDNVVFHRVQNESSFAIVQGGDPQGTGSGGPGYQYNGETPAPTTKYPRGTIAMANSGGPSSNGSQFFIVVHDWDGLPTNYTVFGHVTDPASLATLDRMITATGTPIQGGLGTTPDPAIKIVSATVSAT